MLIGLDVGGTHTDAALVELATGKCVASVKARTRPGDVLPGIVEALEELLRGRDPAAVRRVCVSSTLGLNALLMGKEDATGMLVVPGPGIHPRLFWGEDPLLHVLQGAQDHRGVVVQMPDAADVRRALHALKKYPVKALGIVCKFSPKNPELEQSLAALAREVFGADFPVVLGAEVSGSLNFPRRMHTVWCNAALAGISRAFMRSLESPAKQLGLACPLVILKADAGVFGAAQAAHDPASTMGSGPAASLLGVWALSSGKENAETPDSLMVDMGGTTTDLALLAGGQPLLARDGLRVGWRPTLIRSLWTRSIALGGDSALRIINNTVVAGPERLGPALSLSPEDAGERPPTLTDAMNILGLSALGDVNISRTAMNEFARLPQAGPVRAAARKDSFLEWPVPGNTAANGGNASIAEALHVARLAVENALTHIKEEAAALLGEVNAQPVYTIREMLVDAPLQPAQAVFIGGPAAALANLARQVWGLPVRVPFMSSCANAVGAALARPTRAADLYADTLLGRMTIPALGVEKPIDRTYTAEQARKDMLSALADAGSSGALAETASRPGSRPDCEPGSGAAAQIVFSESFAMLDDKGRRGRIIRIRAQMSAGLITEPGAAS